ncbi:hypothetical protein AZI86_14225 [Bdellovibrio bacteriovorus]|uniref:Intracellular septation protein A n=1 Tax=Bdellovibrio bacteriovorus TaxID=959 RepID=A0A150WJR8_BDEBC|nr:septation protein IspZ [Bdellovibrio bacteriovorus]KYG63962.1 hypothetical protein AZI86_14225 [Bdellovibrio bacteriovorus]
MQKFKEILKFLFLNFGPLIVFYGVNRFYDFKTALITSLVYSSLEIAVHLVRKKPITRFFKFSVLMTCGFGVLDLWLGNAFFFKMEAGVSSLITAFFFGYSLFSGKPLIQEFAEQQNRISSDFQSEDKTFFFKVMTFLWTLYFVIKGAFYLWLGFSTDLESSLIIRLIFGNASFWVLFFVSITFGRQFYKLLEKAQVLPSQRRATSSL